MKKWTSIFRKKATKTDERKELERKAVEGAKRAVREHRAVFDRLAEYDRT